MKVLAKVLVASLTIVMCSGANASVLDSGIVNGFDKSYSAWFSWFSSKPKHKKKHHGWKNKKHNAYYNHKNKKKHNQPKAKGVPELDAATAPLAVLLLGGLLAAGAERRRRKSL